MANEEIRKELKKYNIQDNPFDTMMHMAIELSRFILFSCVRFNNSKTKRMYRIWLEY